MSLNKQFLSFLFLAILGLQSLVAQTNQSPDQINFVRQGVQRIIFDENQEIPLASLKPAKIIGMSAMYPTTFYSEFHADIQVKKDQLLIQSDKESQSSIWFGGFNPFAVYTIDLDSCSGQGELGFEFSEPEKAEQFFVTISYKGSEILDVNQKYVRESKTVVNESILNKDNDSVNIEGKIILQMLGSGFTLFVQNSGLPLPIAQSDFASFVDLREKQYMRSFQSNLYFSIKKGALAIRKVESALSPGMGLADIRAITYEDGEPLLDQGRLWYTMTIRGRALPHHIQGVFSLNPTVFDLRFEGVILFDRKDGLLRNEVASHIFYDRNEKCWRGLTTGFSAYANPDEKKQLLAVDSKKDPRFGFSVMKASPMGMVGDYEDPHILFDSAAKKWRMLACENVKGYKAILLESDEWNKNYQRMAGPVKNNSTGTSIQRIGDERYCFSGSQDRKIYIYTYPELTEAGTLNIDLPPWDETSGTRIWPNVVQLPEGYPFRYVALMMDRFNYPGLKGPNWTYGALYLYHGYE
ncbi:MAG: hypothetical protein K0M40_09950 [Prolixibacteraceae bacterium]|nr:hypothetical protein [Prolixibacteraceae bacterium]